MRLRKVTFTLLITSFSLIFMLPASLHAAFDMLQNLTPAQQEQAMKLLSGGSSLVSGASKTNNKNLNTDNNIQEQVSSDTEEQLLLLEEEKKRLEELLFQPGNTLIVYFNEPEIDSLELERELLKRRIQNKDEDKKLSKYTPLYPQQLFQLDDNSMIEIPGIGLIRLEGLNEKEAAARLNAEPLLQSFDIEVKRLPLKLTGPRALKQFGLDLFERKNLDNRNNVNIPAPADYVVGPGDEVFVQLFGKDNMQHVLTVSREGMLSFPRIGSIAVTGMRFDQLQKDLQKRIKAQFIGVDSYITLGELRSVSVFVSGEVNQPGSYLITALSTVTQALVQTKGIKKNGSLRNIQIKRKGKLVKKIDLYDLLLNGDSSNDIRLQAGDVIHVPIVKNSVSVMGEVRRPAIYELTGTESIEEVITIAGGMLPTADSRDIKITRFISGKQLAVKDIQAAERLSSIAAIPGDIIKIGKLKQPKENSIKLVGHVLKPDIFQWREGIRLTDIISSIDMLKTNADANYVLVKRYLPPDYFLQTKSTSLRKALADPAHSSNIELFPRDELLVLELNKHRVQQVQPVVAQLFAQSSAAEVNHIARIGGQVRGAGSYPLDKGMRISDLVRAGGGLLESAFILEAELSRFVVVQGKPRRIEHIKVDLKQALQGNLAANLVLQAYDFLNIKEIPLWAEQAQVEIIGEVNFPGKYSIYRGEKLSDLLIRAGGMTDYAYPRGAVFIREDLRRREQKRMDDMAASLESELATLSLQRTGQITDLGAVEQLLDKLKATDAVGRLVIDLNKIGEISLGKKTDLNEDIVLRGGDKLFIPSHMQEVSVIGEVFHPTSHLYKKGHSYKNYIDQSGGINSKADKKSIYLIRVNGSVELTQRYWFESGLEIEPGDTIIVPFDADKVSSLVLWEKVTRIVSQLGLTAATWKTLGLFD